MPFARILLALLFLSIPRLAYADDALAPSQALGSDPEPHRPSLGLAVDGGAMLLGDFAASLDVSLLPALAWTVRAGASRREGSDDLLLETGATVFVLGRGLEGPWLAGLVGLGWAGPWNGDGVASWARAGAELGWQFLVGSVALDLGGGVQVAAPFAGLPVDDGAVTPRVEPRVHASLGWVFG